MSRKQGQKRRLEGVPDAKKEAKTKVEALLESTEPLVLDRCDPECKTCVRAPNASFACTDCKRRLIDGNFLTKLINTFWRQEQPIDFGVFGVYLACVCEVDIPRAWEKLKRGYNREIDYLRNYNGNDPDYAEAVTNVIQALTPLNGNEQIYCTMEEFESLIGGFNSCTDAAFPNGMPLEMWGFLMFHSPLVVLPKGYCAEESLVPRRAVAAVWDKTGDCALLSFAGQKLHQYRKKTECKRAPGEPGAPGYDLRHIAKPVFQLARHDASGALAVREACGVHFPTVVARIVSAYCHRLVV